MPQEPVLPLEPPTATVGIDPGVITPPTIEVSPQTSAIAVPAVAGLEGVTTRTIAEEIQLSQELMKQETSLINRIWTMANAAELMERRAMLIETTHITAVRATNPGDWVLSRDRQGVTTGMLRASGSHTVGTYYGISFTQIYVMGTAGKLVPVGEDAFQPTITEDKETGEIFYTVWFDAKSFVTGQVVRSREFSRSSTEDFIGRGVQDSTSKMLGQADHRKSVLTGAYTCACRILGNMTRMDASFLETCWKDTGKSIEKCCKGTGFGSSGSRSVSSATGEDIGNLQAELRDALLALTDNVAEEAQGILFEITEYPPGSGKGCKSVESITNPGRFFHTWKRLSARPDYGKMAEEYVKLSLRDNASKQAKDGVQAGAKDRPKKGS